MEILCICCKKNRVDDGHMNVLMIVLRPSISFRGRMMSAYPEYVQEYISYIQLIRARATLL